MDALILDSKYEHIAPLDEFTSFIWTDRYNKCGDFEIYTPIDERSLQNLQIDRFLWNKESEHLMVIETIHTTQDVEKGNQLYVLGRSLESILDRRIIWNKTKIDGNFQNGIEKMLNENVISPSIPERKIEGFVFKPSDDPRILELTLSAEYQGDNLYDIICSICEEKELGFKLTVNDNKELVFELYFGTDRSYDQEENHWVAFSPKMDNIISTEYLESKDNYKNVAFVLGEDIKNENHEVIGQRSVTVGSASGFDRREVYTDARDISTTDDEGNEIPTDEYNRQLIERGESDLKNYKFVKVFEGEMETRQLYRYGRDFFLGDIVQIENEYGKEGKVRVTEMVMTEDDTGFTAYPTFESLDLEDEKNE